MQSKKYKTGIYIGKFCPLHFGHISLINSMLHKCEKIYVIFYNDKKIEDTIKINENFNYPIKDRIKDAKEVLAYNKNISVIELVIPKEIKFPEHKDLIKEKIKHKINANLDVQYIGLEEEQRYKDQIYADAYECAGIYTIEDEKEIIKQALHAKDIRKNIHYYKKYLPKIIRDKIEK
jgi:cytidyltransferase-like protein